LQVKGLPCRSTRAEALAGIATSRLASAPKTLKNQERDTKNMKSLGIGEGIALNMKNKQACFSHKSDEWETPQNLFDELNKEFKFTLDPCSTDKNHKCNIWYTKKENGYCCKWNGSVFVNPPYSEISRWVEKSFYEKDNCEKIVMLLPARTDTKWFHKFIYKQYGIEIRFIKGRLKFSNSKNSAPFPSMIVIF
jgi:site-specific DNA-methyltransferase (adenine-specific)